MTGGVAEAVVRARGLVKHYGAVRAVDGVDLLVGRGDIYALLGLNGAGKTTTIRMLLAMVAPTAGEVRLFGQQATLAVQQVWGRTGYLVESPAAYPELTVRRNLEVAARLKRLPARAADPVIERLNLGAYASRKAGTLSLGSLQRRYLPAIGAMFVAVFTAQLVAAFGYGAWYPFSVPALHAGLTGDPPTGFGYAAVITVAAASIWATARWWRLADHTR